MRKKNLAQALIIMAAVLGMAAIIRSTHWGPGIGGDATIYIHSASNLLKGIGLGLVEPSGEFRLIPYFPPFFPLVLAALGLIDLDLTAAAGWLNILLFGGLIWLVGRETYHWSESITLGVTASLIVAISPVLIPVYSWAMSEPLAILLGAAGLVLLLRFAQYPNRSRLLVGSAVLCGLSFFTRYSHAAFILAGLLFIHQISDTWLLRIKRAVCYTIISTIPIGIWVAIDIGQTATIASRSMESFGGMLDRLGNFFPLFNEVMLFWFIPDSWISAPPYPVLINYFLVLLAAVVILAWLITLLMKQKEAVQEIQKLTNAARLLSLFILSYILVILMVYITTYPPITIGSRMFSPVHVTFLWLVIVLMAQSLHFWKKIKWIKVLLTLGLGLFLFSYGWRAERISSQYYKTGLGYTSPAWQESDLVAQVLQMPEDALIISNEQTAILYLTGRTVYPLAEIYFDKPVKPFLRYGDGNLTRDDGQALFKNKGATLVLFDSIYEQMSSIYGDLTEARVGVLVQDLEKIYQGWDGAIYRYPLEED